MSPYPPPDGEQIQEAVQALELEQADAKEPQDKIEWIIGTILWLKGEHGGMAVGDFIASIISKQDQLNAKARDRNQKGNQEPEGGGDPGDGH